MTELNYNNFIKWLENSFIEYAYFVKEVKSSLFIDISKWTIKPFRQRFKYERE